MKETNDYGMYSGGYIFDQMDRAALEYIRTNAGLPDTAVLVTMTANNVRFKRQLCDKYNVVVHCVKFGEIKLFSTLYTCFTEVINNKGEVVAEAEFTFTLATNHCEIKERKDDTTD